MNAGAKATLFLLASTVALAGATGTCSCEKAPPAPTAPSDPTLTGHLSTVGVTLELPQNGEMIRVQQSQGRLARLVVGFGNDRLVLRVSEGIDSAKAKSLVKEERFMIEHLFEDRQAPYPGQLTNTLRCPDRFRPKDVEAKAGALALFTAYANDRLSFGGCSEDLVRYHATIGFFYEEASERLVRAEYFAAVEAPDPGLEVLRSIVMEPTAPLPASATQQARKPSTEINWSYRRSPQANDEPLCDGCNLLLISLDIFRPDHMECMGYGKTTSPNMCQMAKEGALFENFIVHAYQTPVSQMSIFTGRYPSSNGFVSFTSKLADDMPYFPEAMKKAGYNTAAIGSSFEVMSDMSEANKGKKARFHRDDLNPGMSFGRGFDRFVFTGNRNLPTDAIPWLADRGNEKFFLWLIFGSLHWPYGAQGDPTLRDMFDPPDYSGLFTRFHQLGFGVLSRIYKGKHYDLKQKITTDLSPQDSAYITARYDFGLWTVDQFIGEMMEAMPPEVMENTLIVLHGVHGEDLGEHGYFGHYDIFDTEIKNAVIVLIPRQRTQAKRVVEQVEAVDLAPTMLDLLGVPPLANTDGKSFAEALKTGQGDPNRPAFSERIPLWEDIFRHRTQMPPRYVKQIKPILDSNAIGDTSIRTLKWKLIHRRARHIEAQVSWWAWLSGTPLERTEWELYDLSADPGEMNNVVSDKPGVAVELKTQLLAWEKENNIELAEGG